MNLFNEYDIIKDIPHILLGNKSDLISEINENLMNDFAKSNRYSKYSKYFKRSKLWQTITKYVNYTYKEKKNYSCILYKPQ